MSFLHNRRPPNSRQQNRRESSRIEAAEARARNHLIRARLARFAAQLVRTEVSADSIRREGGQTETGIAFTWMLAGPMVKELFKLPIREWPIDSENRLRTAMEKGELGIDVGGIKFRRAVYLDEDQIDFDEGHGKHMAHDEADNSLEHESNDSWLPPHLRASGSSQSGQHMALTETQDHHEVQRASHGTDCDDSGDEGRREAGAPLMDRSNSDTWQAPFTPTGTSRTLFTQSANIQQDQNKPADRQPEMHGSEAGSVTESSDRSGTPHSGIRIDPRQTAATDIEVPNLEQNIAIPKANNLHSHNDVEVGRDDHTTNHVPSHIGTHTEHTSTHATSQSAVCEPTALQRTSVVNYKLLQQLTKELTDLEEQNVVLRLELQQKGHHIEELERKCSMQNTEELKTRIALLESMLDEKDLEMARQCDHVEEIERKLHRSEQRNQELGEEFVDNSIKMRGLKKCLEEDVYRFAKWTQKAMFADIAELVRASVEEYSIKDEHRLEIALAATLAEMHNLTEASEPVSS
ncbi:hypothetical protein EX30DRAFT_344570 [Ascodesmis nigricans]|uniref:Uncharacterized protein n=1 Tax=Ascodesmis nigricans TaxID=341454 RepID=A0A4S2MJ89_9PEZI|nr:hypothetical protein EX30DRAFT_344570 [Ascodesmis nigricans]